MSSSDFEMIVEISVGKMDLYHLLLDPEKFVASWSLSFKNKINLRVSLGTHPVSRIA